MFQNRPGDSQGLFKSVMMAYAVLVLHVLLIAGLGLLVLFFRGVAQYMVWIFLAGACGLAVSGYLFYRRMRTEGKTLKEMLQSPTFGGRAVEVSFLGGLASFRLGQQSAQRELPGTSEDLLRLEDPDAFRKKELEALLRLLEKNLISPEEYQKAKQDILKS
jgi:hypothetical protein